MPYWKKARAVLWNLKCERGEAEVRAHIVKIAVSVLGESFLSVQTCKSLKTLNLGKGIQVMYFKEDTESEMSVLLCKYGVCMNASAFVQ